MKQPRSLISTLGRFEGLPIFMVLVVLFIVFYFTAPLVFSGTAIYMSFLETVPPVLVLALGLTFVITAGEIDLSFPAIVAFSGFIFAWVFKTFTVAPYESLAPFAPWIGFLLALVGGGFVGYINGLLVARIGVPSIMATLASQFFWYGVTVLLAGGLSWSIGTIQTTPMHAIFSGRLFGQVPMQAFWALGLAIFLWFLLNRHTFGESIMFIGDNPNVARVMGINVERTKIKLFTMMGVIAAFSGLLLTIDINVFFPTQGQGFLLPALASVFIGGTSIAGGLGSMFGTLFGSYVIGSLEAGVVATGISGYWVQLVEGIVMAAVVILNIVIEQGSLNSLRNRMMHWTKGSNQPAPDEALERRDEPAGKSAN